MDKTEAIMKLRCWFEDDFFVIWYQDKQSMIETMVRNLIADLDAGYDFHGNTIISQLRQIEEYRMEFFKKIEEFKDMSEIDINKWCRKDLIKRGVIE